MSYLTGCNKGMRRRGSVVKCCVYTTPIAGFEASLSLKLMRLQVEMCGQKNSVQASELVRRRNVYNKITDLISTCPVALLHARLESFPFFISLVLARLPSMSEFQIQSSSGFICSAINAP